MEKYKELVKKWRKEAEEMIGQNNNSLMSMGMNSGEISQLRDCAHELERVIEND